MSLNLWCNKLFSILFELGNSSEYVSTNFIFRRMFKLASFNFILSNLCLHWVWPVTSIYVPHTMKELWIFCIVVILFYIMPVVVTLCTSTKCRKPIILFFPEFFWRTAGKEKNGCSAFANGQTCVELYMPLNLKIEEKSLHAWSQNTYPPLLWYGIIELVISSNTWTKTARSRCWIL